MLKALKRKYRDNKKKKETVKEIVRKTGWTPAEAQAQLEDAVDRLGIRYNDYVRMKYYKLSPEEQNRNYERRQVRKKNKNEKTLQSIMKVTGWEHDYAEERVLEAQERTGCTYKEFLMYRFYDLTEQEQSEVFVAKYSRKITAKYDVNNEFNDMLYDKERTNVFFSEYLKRPWCVNTKITLEEFTEMFAESERVIYKPLDGNRGRGVEAFDVNRENAKEVFQQLATYPDGVVEQYVVQHPEISNLAPGSVNTVRVVTISSNTRDITADGKRKDIAYASIRIGGGTSIVDNFHSGGMVAVVDLETGKIDTHAADMEGNVYEQHPYTGTTIKGYQLPYFEEVKAMVLDAISKYKVEGYLGWDIAITEDGPVLIEVNVIPAVALLSMPYVAERKGMKHVMAKYMQVSN